ncbi:MAG: flagellar basal body L-ring protein FlgH, partial [Phycisphaerales bacterium]|nr:flagellar basal body L-ring protein FlgH [Phycisphaerales bacterium]
ADAAQPPAQQPAQQQQAQAAAPAPQRALPGAYQVSLFAVKPASQRQFNKQDKIEIIVNETSLQKFEQNNDSKESADIDASLKAMPNLHTLLTDFALRNNGAVTPKLSIGNGSTYKGQGAYERKDRFTARISALVTDVKPNGMLVLEARETILSDKESKSLVVSGLCDPKDITTTNTVTSSQLANLVIKTEHGGDVKDAATKGWLPRVFDALSGN